MSNKKGHFLVYNNALYALCKSINNKKNHFLCHRIADNNLITAKQLNESLDRVNRISKVLSLCSCACKFPLYCSYGPSIWLVDVAQRCSTIDYAIKTILIWIYFQKLTSKNIEQYCVKFKLQIIQLAQIQLFVHSISANSIVHSTVL